MSSKRKPQYKRKVAFGARYSPPAYTPIKGNDNIVFLKRFM
ncbi:hypothetical protein HMPREF9072_00509 [Capnocytophaga sp. oral taxon 324 str. F0483]|nr:hypothetical protein HMPREF9072_00509 [Capnocytophaga sp. oral taxon 324 str. F0483]